MPKRGSRCAEKDLFRPSSVPTFVFIRLADVSLAFSFSCGCRVHVLQQWQGLCNVHLAIRSFEDLLHVQVNPCGDARGFTS